jgi:hypothetical protein
MVVNGGRAIHLFWSTKFGCVPQSGFTSICYDLLIFCRCLKTRIPYLPSKKTPIQIGYTPLACGSEQPPHSALWRYTHLDSYKRDRQGNLFYRAVWEDTTWFGAVPSDIYKMASVIHVGNDHLSSCRVSYITWHPSWVDAEELLGDGDTLHYFWMNVTYRFHPCRLDCIHCSLDSRSQASLLVAVPRPAGVQ